MSYWQKQSSSHESLILLFLNKLFKPIKLLVWNSNVSFLNHIQCSLTDIVDIANKCRYCKNHLLTLSLPSTPFGIMDQHYGERRESEGREGNVISAKAGIIIHFFINIMLALSHIFITMRVIYTVNNDISAWTMSLLYGDTRRYCIKYCKWVKYSHFIIYQVTSDKLYVGLRLLPRYLRHQREH